MRERLAVRRRVVGSASLATLLALAAMAPGVANAAEPGARSGSDTFVEVVAGAELQLVAGPGRARAEADGPQWVGKRDHGKPEVSRLFFSFDLTGLPAEAFTEVLLEHRQVSSPNRTCHLDSYGPGVEVATTGPVDPEAAFPGPEPTSDPVVDGYAVGTGDGCVVSGGRQTWDVTDMVRRAAAGSGTVWLRLASDDETDRAGYREYNTDIDGTPSLRVFLSPHPDQPTNVTIAPTAPRSPTDPLVTAAGYPTLRADVTTPGGCRGTTVLFTCLSARYEVVAEDGSVVQTGSGGHLFETGRVASLSVGIGPLEEGVTYTARVWGVNTQTGLESVQPGVTSFRYDPPPSAPAATPVGRWAIDQPLQLTVTAGDADAEQVCWRLSTGADPMAGCVDVQPQQPTTVVLGQLADPTALHGEVWTIDRWGSRGAPTILQEFVAW